MSSANIQAMTEDAPAATASAIRALELHGDLGNRADQAAALTRDRRPERDDR